jgi:hypothetical protein
MNGHIYMCKFILEHVIEKNPINNLGTTPRGMAFSRGYLNIAYLITYIESFEINV